MLNEHIVRVITSPTRASYSALLAMGVSLELAVKSSSSSELAAAKYSLLERHSEQHLERRSEHHLPSGYWLIRVQTGLILQRGLIKLNK